MSHSAFTKSSLHLHTLERQCVQALLAKITERQRDINAARERSRTLGSSSEVQAAQAEVQEEMEEVTKICKNVKAKLLELDNLNGEFLSDDQV